MEVAGGMAESGHGPVLDIQPTELHQRTPIFIGSKKMVEKAMEFVQVREAVN
jgi:fructose-1,6-bisphosphatase I